MHRSQDGGYTCSVDGYSRVHHPERAALGPNSRGHMREPDPELECGARQCNLDDDSWTDYDGHTIVPSGGLRLTTQLMGPIPARWMDRAEAFKKAKKSRPISSAAKR